MSKSIRVTALALIQRPDGKFLVEKGFDSKKNETFYRLIGGGVEFGETGAEAVAREFIEELGKTIVVEKHIASVENIFEFEGEKGHEIVLIHTASFSDTADYTPNHLPRIDGNDGQTYWMSLEDIAHEGAKIYPVQVRDFV